ncbi:MAG: hypothetical protein R3F61_34915 [Myxococcota bacterium]
MQRTPTVVRALAKTSLLAALSLGIGNVASASTVVLTPMVSNGADEKTVMNLFHLMSSELEFMPMVDSLEEATPRPPSLNTDCVANESCLRGIASTFGGNAVFTGVLTAQGPNLVMDLVYFEDGRIVRRKPFTVSSDATQIANAMTGILNEMMTGKSAQTQAQAAPPSADTFSTALDDGDDFFSAPPAPAPVAMGGGGGGFDGLVDAGPTQAELAYQAQQEQARRAAEDQARRAADEQARRAAEEQARRAAEEQARRAAEEEARRRAEEDARRRAEEEARRRAEEQARLAAEEQARRAAEDQARRAAEDQARRAAEEQEIARKRAENERLAREEAARRQAEEQARMQAANSAMSTAPSAGTISFANSASQISAEDINAVIQFGAPSGAPAPTAYSPTSYSPPANTYTPPPSNAYAPPPNAYQQPYTPPPAPAYGNTAPAYGNTQPAYNNYGAAPAPTSGYGASAPADLALEEQELAAMADPTLLDLDNDKKNKNRNKAGGSANSSTTLDRATPKTLQLTVRGGYSRYYAFNFITAGAEVGVPLTKGLMAVAGIEAYSVQRELPPAAQVPGQPIYQWNTIYPMNLGLSYKFKTGTMFVPYVGADAIFVQYYKDAVGADWAGGARAKGGVDVMLAKNFGLNANLAVGGWTGKNWTLIEPTIGNSGLLPQINAGTVFAF